MSATTIDENEFSRLTGTVIDPGVEDSFILDVVWGDGATDQFSLAAGTSDFEFTHQYLDDEPTLTSSDDITISVTITDDDLDSGDAETTATVNNVAPALGCIMLSLANTHSSG